MKYEFEYEIDSKKKEPCWVCGRLTNRIEINYEARICSVKCVKKKDKEFWKALKKK